MTKTVCESWCVCDKDGAEEEREDEEEEEEREGYRIKNTNPTQRGGEK